MPAGVDQMPGKNRAVTVCGRETGLRTSVSRCPCSLRTCACVCAHKESELTAAEMHFLFLGCCIQGLPRLLITNNHTTPPTGRGFFV